MYRYNPSDNPCRFFSASYRHRHDSIAMGMIFLLLLLITDAEVQSVSPTQGFFTVIQNPAAYRSSRNVYIHALYNLPISDVISIRKNDSSEAPALPLTQILFEFNIAAPAWGASLGFSQQERNRGSRFGAYAARTNGQLNACAYGFIRPKSAYLGTSGVYTVTVYPERSFNKELSSDSPEFIKVSSSAAKYRLTWWKDRKRLRNTKPRMALESTDDAGLYTVKRTRRGKSWAATQILVIAATCQSNQYWSGRSGCRGRTRTCTYGVPTDAADDCTCMPFFAHDADLCSITVDRVGDNGIHVLGNVGDLYLQCHDLPGGSFNCKGMLICYGDLYGCKCANGWQGENCDKPCPVGKWGADCSEDCPENEPICNRFIGTNGPLDNPLVD